MEGFREILLNAINHKDYSTGIPIQISIYEDKIYVWNDGKWPDKLNDAEACMLRELYEELHLTFEDIENTALRYVTLRRTKEEIRQNYYFFANLKEHVDDNLASNEGICKWFSLNETSSLEMPFTAKYVMDHFCTYGRYTDKIYVGIAEIDGVKFLDLPYTENKKL